MSVAVTRSPARDCLVCGLPTQYAHMDIDLCRACAVFYRRANQRRQRFVCRTGSFQCDTMRRDFGCKRCRYDRLATVLNESQKHQCDQSSCSSVDAESSTSSSRTIPRISNLSASTPAPEGSVLASLRRGCKLMSAIRRASELSTRSNDSLDLQGIFVDGMVVLPATYGTLNKNIRIFISSMFEFASSSFEDFSTLDHDDKWQLIRNFYPFIAVLDSEYRMTTMLPQKGTMIFSSYCTYIDHDTIAHFLSDTPSEKHREVALGYLSAHLEGDVRRFRDKMRRWNPSEDEYTAFVGIAFWSLDKINVSEKVHRMGEKYSRSLFLELDRLYRHSMNIDDYATRMGEAVMFLDAIQTSFLATRSMLGVLQLLDIIGEEMLIAQLHQ